MILASDPAQMRKSGRMRVSRTLLCNDASLTFVTTCIVFALFPLLILSQLTRWWQGTRSNSTGGERGKITKLEWKGRRQWGGERQLIQYVVREHEGGSSRRTHLGRSLKARSIMMYLTRLDLSLSRNGRWLAKARVRYQCQSMKRNKHRPASQQWQARTRQPTQPCQRQQGVPGTGCSSGGNRGRTLKLYLQLGKPAGSGPAQE